jgi:hypothetical protein
MGHGRVFALYLALYCSARGVIETLRIDEAHHVAGIRLNVFTSVLVGSLGLFYLLRSLDRNPGREVLNLEPKAINVPKSSSRRRIATENPPVVTSDSVEGPAARIANEEVAVSQSPQAPSDASIDGPKPPRIRRIKQD